MSDDSDNFEFSDEDIDDKRHEKIVENVLKLNKVQHVKSARRTEPATLVSEFNLVKSLTGNNNIVHVNELTKVLKDRKKHVQIANKVKSASGRSNTLPAPLEKPQADRIKRSLNYEKSRLQLDRWEALVQSNRAAPQLVFPLDSIEKLKILEKKAEKYPSSFRIKSELQKKLEALEPKVEEYHIETEEKEFPLTLEELKEKRKESAKLRAHQSFKEAKARRQNKIKSKKYHRILRRERIKQQLKDFEELQKTNPEEALKKLEDIDRARAEERFSLRHKGTGQWARNKQIRAKYDKESRQVLAQQLSISRDLTQKVKPVESESEDEGIEAGRQSSTPLNPPDESNPWVNRIKPTKDVADFISGYRKYWNDKNNNKEDQNNINNENLNAVVQETKDEVKLRMKTAGTKKKAKQKIKVKQKPAAKSKKVQKEISENDSSLSTSSWEVSPVKNKSGPSLDIEDVFHTLEDKFNHRLKQKVNKIKNKKTGKIVKLTTKKAPGKKKIDLSMPSKKKKQIIDEEMDEHTRDTEDNPESNNPDLLMLKSIIASTQRPDETVNINPDNFMRVEQTNINNAIPDILTNDENEEINQRDIIVEAFEDDDIAADFDKEKASEIDKDTPKDIDLNLPGWGSWGGVGIDSSKRKRKRFVIKMPPKMPRRDDNKGSLIINEKAQAKIKPLLVSEVPFPFKSVKDYEASMRAPIGSTFVPETAFRKHIEPAVITKMGSIIEPINKNILIGRKKVI